MLYRVFQHAKAGMVAGVFTTIFMAPGERVKCLMQVSRITCVLTDTHNVTSFSVWCRFRCIKRLVRPSTLAPLTVLSSSTGREALEMSTVER